MIKEISLKIGRLGLAVALGFLVLGNQGCTGFVAMMDEEGTVDIASIVPSTDKYDENCQTNSAFDACIIQQNPAVRGAKLSQTVAGRTQDVAKIAKYGVKLSSLGTSGFLENSTISIHSLKGPRASANPKELKSEGSLDLNILEQVNTFYWINRAAEYFDLRTEGKLPAKGQALKVIIDDTMTGYDAKKNTIRLKSTETTSMGLNGDIAIHLFGVANLFLANPMGWESLSASNHSTCDAISEGCCKAAKGCANAIRFGVGEYFAISMFPEHTAIGEGVVNNGKVQTLSGVSRDVASVASSSANSVYTTSKGSIQAMGLLYASIWWEIRGAAGPQINEIDRIFLEHLSELNGTDDFKSALDKAKVIDSRLFSGRHAKKFDDQIAARGL